MGGNLHDLHTPAAWEEISGMKRTKWRGKKLTQERVLSLLESCQAEGVRHVSSGDTMILRAGEEGEPPEFWELTMRARWR